MDDRTFAQAFEQEIAAMLSGLQPPVEPDRGDLHESIQVAKQLRALATEWGRLASPALQQEVASIAERAQVGVEHGAASGRFVGRRMVRFGVAMTAAATLIIVAIPAARQGVARQLYRVLDVVAVGADTEVVRPDAGTPGEIAATVQQFDRQLASGRMWHISTAYGGFGGGVPPGASPALQRVDRLDILSSLTAMAIQLPTAPYRGRVPTFSYALVAPDGPLFLFFGSGNNEILLVQAAVRPGHGVQYSRVIGGTEKQGRFTTYSPELKTEELVLDGHTVVWDPDSTALMPNSSALRWERERVTYSLLGRALTRDEAVQLFLGLRPANTQQGK
jgi:hypothetical protein